MSKRTASPERAPRTQAKLSADAGPTKTSEEGLDVEMGEFEDPYGDEFESDGEIVEINDEADEEEQENTTQAEPTQEIYLPHKSRPLGPDEVLEADPLVYDMLHNVNLPWPCLTVDIVPDSLGDERRSFPAAMTVVTATQAPKAKDNELLILKLSQLAKTLEKDDDEDDEQDDDDQYGMEPVMESEHIPFRSTTNRVRAGAFQDRVFVATLMEDGDVNVYDVSSQLRSLDVPGNPVPKNAKRPAYTVRAHGNVEGYGLDWSPVEPGSLLTGDVSGRVFFSRKTPSGWTTDKSAFHAADQSVEDIQWSRSEKTVFATGDCGGFVRIWDTRLKKHKPALSVSATQTDVNVLSWSSKTDYLLALGHDDGLWGVWDLRNFAPGAAPVAGYDFHKSAITLISFSPQDESVVAVASEDNTVTLWDLAVEADDEEIVQQRKEVKEMEGIPPQLLFVHWQKDVKEVRWHPQIPGALVSVGSEGMNLWKTISV